MADIQPFVLCVNSAGRFRGNALTPQIGHVFWCLRCARKGQPGMAA
jgi:hypothetical protein